MPTARWRETLVARYAAACSGHVFSELADKFQPLVDALNEVSETSYTHSDKDILRLYEIWLKTGSSAVTRFSSAWVSIRPPRRTASRTDHDSAGSSRSLIGGIYDVRVAHDVYDFLVTDRGELPRRRAPASRRATHRRSADTDEGDAKLAFRSIWIRRCWSGCNAPIRCRACTTAMSPTTGRRWRGQPLPVPGVERRSRPAGVRLLELEMQAEVDKYVASYWLCASNSGALSCRVAAVLFERTRIDPRWRGARGSLPRRRAATRRSLPPARAVAAGDAIGGAAIGGAVFGHRS